MTLKEYIEKNNLSHSDIAAMTGLSVSTVCRNASGETMPERKNIDLYAEATNSKVTFKDWA